MKRDNYSSANKKRRLPFTTVALTVTIIILAFTLLLTFSPAFKQLISGGNKGELLENKDQTRAQSDNEIRQTGVDGDEAETGATTTEEVAKLEESQEDIQITLLATGDVLLHMPVIDGVKKFVDGQVVYQFDPIFEYITDLISDADYAVLNFEGTLGGEPYSGYPMFSAPDDIVPALKRVGFDLANTVNNHSIDRGLAGLLRTVEVFRDYDLPNIGTKMDSADKSYLITDVGGIMIGFSSFSFETIGTEDSRALNGIAIPQEAEALVDSFNPYREDVFEKDIQKILARITAMRAEGAEFICMVMHWGDEYHTHSNPYQQGLAQILADAGVDLVIGHHPHVIQEIDFIKATDSDHEMPVYYSLGNFISNQYYDTGNSAGKAQDGLAARITIVKKAGSIQITETEFIPTHVVRVSREGLASHRVVPVIAALEDPAAYETTYEMMAESLARTMSIMEANGSSNKLELTAVGF